MNDKKERVIIFIDGSNLYHITKDRLKGQDCYFDFQEFTEYISKGSELIEIYYYTAPLDRKLNKEAYTKQQRFFDNLRKMPKFNLILCRMQKKKINGKIIYQVKEDDIHLAVDMVKLAYKNKYENAILVSSDGDFVPAVKAIQEINKKVRNIGFTKRFSYYLKQECDDCKIINDDILSTFIKQNEKNK